MPAKSLNSNIQILEPLEFLDYLHPKLEDFVTKNFITKWQDKVELSCLIFPYRTFEGPSQMFCMCKLFYIGHLTYKFSLQALLLGLCLAFTRALRILNHYFFVPIQVFLYMSYVNLTCFRSFTSPFFNHVQVLYIFFSHSCTCVCALH